MKIVTIYPHEEPCIYMEMPIDSIIIIIIIIIIITLLLPVSLLLLLLLTDNLTKMSKY